MGTGSITTRFSKYWYASGSTSLQQSAKNLAAGTDGYVNGSTTAYTFTLYGANFEDLRNLQNVKITGFSLGVEGGRYNNTSSASQTLFSFRIVSGLKSNSSNYDTSITTDAVVVVKGSYKRSWHYYTEQELPELLTWMNNNLTSLMNGYTTGSFAFRGYAKYALCGDISFTIDYTYDTKVTGVTVSPTTVSLAVGKTKTLTATIAPSDATNKSVTWSTSNSSVATVSSSGKVTAKSKGTANITVTTSDGGYTATCSVTVTQPVTGVSLNTNTLNLNIGGTSTLTATVSPSNANNKNVTWSSSNTSIATVSNGVVTAIASGITTITVTTSDGGFTATCQVTVINPSIHKIITGTVAHQKIYVGNTEIKKAYLGTTKIFEN